MDQARARSNADENLLVSPMTVYRSLTLARSGARGRTAIELNLALGLPADASARDVEFTVGRVTSSVIDDAQNTWTESSEGETIANANRAFVSDAFQVDESINERNLETLGDSFVNKNFREQAERSRQEINAWVNEQTRNRFKNLVPPGAMSSSTRLVLVDATWFKGDWEHAFDKRRTKRLPFLVNGTKSERVPTMRLASNFRVFDVEGQDYRAIELPYVRHRISMTLVVPKEGHDLKSLESRLDLSQVIELVAKRPRTKVDLRLPRFQVESSTSVSLLDTLRSMDLGLETAFGDARADFFALTPTLAPLAIDDVFHKSVLVVNEYGGIPATSLDKTKTQKQTSGNATRFYVDRPFLFFVHHKQSKTLLFAGRIMDPLRRH